GIGYFLRQRPRGAFRAQRLERAAQRLGGVAHCGEIGDTAVFAGDDDMIERLGAVTLLLEIEGHGTSSSLLRMARIDLRCSFRSRVPYVRSCRKICRRIP